MGFLGLSLIFAGAVLCMNGLNALFKVDAKSTAVMNIITGSILTLDNFISLFTATETWQYMNIASGLIFGITYLFVACNCLFKLDLRPFGFFCFFAAVYAAVMAVYAFAGYTGLGKTDMLLGGLWAAWFLIWLEGFLELGLGKQKVGKVYPWLVIATGLFSAFVPGILMLTGVVPF